MKFLVVLCAAVACAVAKPGFAYSSIAASPLIGAHGLGYAGLGLAPGLSRGAIVAHGAHIAAPALSAYAAPALSAYGAPVLSAYAAPAAIAAPAISAYAAPAAIAAPAIAAPAISAYAAPAVTAYAAPAAIAAAPVVAAAPVIAAAPAVTKTQYHAQNEIGQAAYGHSEPLQTHNAVQDAHGNKVGSFSYLNPHDGQVHRTDYVADALGYRVASNDLPAAPLVAPVAVGHGLLRHRRGVVVSHTPLLTQTPGSTALLGHAAIAAPALTYAAAPALAYSAAPALAYSAVLPNALVGAGAPLTVAAPLGLAAPAIHGIPATLTTITNNPGHAVSYRVD